MLRTASLLLSLLLLQETVLRVDVQLQEVIVSVRDAQNRLVRNLRAEDFLLEENGVPMVSCAVITSGQPSRIQSSDPRLQTEYALRRAESTGAARRVVRRFVFPHRKEHVGQLSGERRNGDGRSSSLGDTFRPLDHRILGPPKIQRPGGLSQRPSHLWRTSSC